MDRAEAARLLRLEMTGYARRSHAELAGLIGEIDAYEVLGADGVTYQVEVGARWDGEPGGSIMVHAGIDDGSFRGAFRPVTDSFLIDPDGTVRMAGDDTG
jgi:hypothetical protein